MRDDIEARVLEEAAYIAEKGETVRGAARHFAVSKSTIHKDITDRLPQLNAALSEEVKRILETNKAERHLRGGEATHRKYTLLAQAQKIRG